MTREEAIHFAVCLKNNWTIDFNDMEEFCDIAIEALSLTNLKEEFESADAVQGEWILVKGSNGKDYHKCSKCLHTQEITGVKNYCAVCGTRMKEGEE